MMSPDFDQRLRALAEVVIRIGLNLQPGQPLLITDPYELQGIHPEAQGLAEAIRTTAGNATILTANPAHLRALVEQEDTRELDRLLSGHIARLHRHLASGGAFLFLTGSAPRLFEGIHPVHIAKFDQLKWRHLGPLIQQLIRGATQWTLVPAPTTAWADAAYAELPAVQRLPALWRIVFESFRVPGWNLTSGQVGIGSGEYAQLLETWRAHLAALALRRDGLNTARHRHIRYVGPDTDLTLDLPRLHAWCTAQLTAKSGLPFVVNLPTEEVFTAPHRNSAQGRVRVAHPVVHAGTVIAGITLEFAGGRVVAAQAETNSELLQQLLATDDGARRIGEVAIVPNRPGWAPVSIPAPVADKDISNHPRSPCFHHIILDENATNHIALGDAYRFCSRAWLPVSLNSSQIHVDLPLDARVELS
jgi:aminopeptidase